MQRRESLPPFEESRDHSLTNPFSSSTILLTQPYKSSKEIARLEIDLVGEEAALCENDIDEKHENSSDEFKLSLKPSKTKSKKIPMDFVLKESMN